MSSELQIILDARARAAYVQFLDTPAVRTSELVDGLLMDHSAEGRAVGIEILSAQALAHLLAHCDEIRKSIAAPHFVAEDLRPIEAFFSHREAS